MKVAIQCDSPLLQRSLELFLEGHLTSYRHCDILIRDKNIRDDEHPTFIIGTQEGSDLIKPFSKAELFHALAQTIEKGKISPILAMETKSFQDNTQEGVSFEILERHIDKLTQEYQANILKAIRAFYEK
ncbi:hypothetical protein [Sulfuricurvum sp.]|uniref:hypothetical protein n=1 Tax=Sulfuricurvum sp. TaxID=2025608 RepID=UPI00356B1B7E